MKKLHVLIPSLVAVSAMPFVGLVGCGNKEPKEHDYAKDYLTITALTDGYFECDIERQKTEEISLDLWYSINDGDWKQVKHNYEYEGSLREYRYSYEEGDIIRLKGENDYFSFVNDDSEWYTSLHFSELVNVSGNVMSLVYGDDFIGKTNLKCDGIFSELFSNCYDYDDVNFSQILNAKNLILPATTLTEGCYIGMFDDCFNLTTAPKLPATKLADWCYNAMFADTNLKIAPELPATQLADYCYDNMFSGSSLLIAPTQLPAEILAENCYNSMFYYCSNLIQPPKLLAKSLANLCCASMFYYCESLNISENNGTNAFFTCLETGTLITPCNEMFVGTGGDFKGTPTTGNTYYWNEPS